MFDEHVVTVHHYCLRRLSAADANDAVSEVFLVAWRKVDRVPSGDATLPWLIGVARNEVRNQHRSARRRLRLVAKTGVEVEEQSPDPALQVVRADEYEEVATALAGLRVDDQDVIRLRVWDELTAPQIAMILGCSEAAAAKRLTRALARLNKALERSSARHRKKGGAD